MIWVIVFAVTAVVVVSMLYVASRRRSRDGVDTFRRQIDALSPEARRPVVDQVQNAAGRHDPEAGDHDDEDETDDEGGARGT